MVGMLLLSFVVVLFVVIRSPSNVEHRVSRGSDGKVHGNSRTRYENSHSGNVAQEETPGGTMLWNLWVVDVDFDVLDDGRLVFVCRHGSKGEQ